MWLYTLATYLHLLSIIIMFSALIVESLIMKERMTKNNIKILKKVDLFFGIFAGLTASTGVLRMYYFGKGVDY